MKDRVFYLLIFGLTLMRVLSSKILPCRPYFDCNSYIQMAHALSYDPSIAPHHAMRVLPPLLAHGLEGMGFSLLTAFRLLSGGTYILFGMLTFWVLRRLEIKQWVAFAFSLLCLASYHAMRIPLQTVYQACDMMTYPIALMIIYFSLRKKIVGIFIFSVIGIFVRQNIFVLGELSLCFCIWQTRRGWYVVFPLLLGAMYQSLQLYYHATGVVSHHVIPDSAFFSFSRIIWIFEDSKLFQIILPILPFLILYFKQIVLFFLRYWHIGLYVGIVAGQPFLAYHLTGNNFARLALQGLWILFFTIPIITKERQWSFSIQVLMVVYASLIYLSWGAPQRLLYMILFSIGIMIIHLYKKVKISNVV